MKIQSRVVKVWDIHAFCVFCGDHIVISVVNDPSESPAVFEKLRETVPVCPNHAYLFRNDDGVYDGPIWQTFAEYEAFLDATH